MSNSGGNGGNGPVYAGVPPGQVLPPMSGAHTHTITTGAVVKVPDRQYFQAQLVRDDGCIVNTGLWADIVAEFFEIKDGNLLGYNVSNHGLYIGGGGRSAALAWSVRIPDRFSVKIVPLNDDRNYVENLKKMTGDDIQAIRNFVEMMGGGDGSKA